MTETNPISEAKKYFNLNLRKGKLLELKDIQFTLDSDSEDSPLYYELLKKWYLTITTLTFIPKELKQVEEIFIHSASNIIIKTAKDKTPFESDLTREDLDTICEILVHKNNLSWNYQNPFVSFHTKIHGHDVRVSMIHFSTGPNHISKLFIRVLKNDTIPISKYRGDEGFYRELIKSKRNVLIAGSTGSGKTTDLPLI